MKTTAQFPFRMALGMLAYVGAVLLLWLALPDGGASVAILAVVALGGLFVGLGALMQARGLKKQPTRRPTTPPSASRG